VKAAFAALLITVAALCTLARCACAASVTLAMVTVEPGKQVGVSVELQTGGNEQVGAIQMDCVFDATALALAAATPGDAAVAAGKTIALSLLEPGRARILVSGLNQQSIPSGVAATLQFAAKEGASPGVYAITPSEVHLTDPRGFENHVASVPGEITIVETAPACGSAQSGDSRRSHGDAAIVAILCAVLAVWGMRGHSTQIRRAVIPALLVLWAATAASAATLSIGNAAISLPGETAGVPLSLAAAPGEQVAGIQMDIHYNSGSFTLETVTAGETAVAASKQVSCTTSGIGTVRIILVGMSMDPLSDGVFAVLKLKATASIVDGVYPVTCQSFFLSDPWSASIAATVTAGDVIAGNPLFEVPDAVAQTVENAQAIVRAAGFTPGAISHVHSQTVAPGLVISQAPEAGTQAHRGTAVDLALSIGPPPVIVPTLAGLTLAAAHEALAAAGLAPGGISEQPSSTIPGGCVISQLPLPGTEVAPGSTVDLTLSSGPLQVEVPNLVSLTKQEALAALATAELQPLIDETFSAIVPEGHVISQEPAAGTEVAAQTHVTLLISKGDNTPVPTGCHGLPGRTSSEKSGDLLAIVLTTLVFNATRRRPRQGGG